MNFTRKYIQIDLSSGVSFRFHYADIFYWDIVLFKLFQELLQILKHKRHNAIDRAILPPDEPPF